MRTPVGGLVAVVVLSCSVGMAFAAAGQHAAAPPQAATPIDNPAARDSPPMSMPPAYREQPSYQPVTSSGDRYQPVRQDEAGTKPVSRPIVKPPAIDPPCTERPDRRRWANRANDLLVCIKRTARKIGLIQAVLIPDELTFVKGMSERPAGWAAYAFLVPGRGTLRVTLEHPNLGWFQLLMVDKWGQLEEGMLPNLIHTGKPQVSFKNPGAKAALVFVIVDDPGWMSSESSLYKLTIDRDWEPGKLGPNAPLPDSGVWAIVDPIIKWEDEVAAATPAAPAAPAPVPAEPRD